MLKSWKRISNKGDYKIPMESKVNTISGTHIERQKNIEKTIIRFQIKGVWIIPVSIPT